MREYKGGNCLEAQQRSVQGDRFTVDNLLL